MKEDRRPKDVRSQSRYGEADLRGSDLHVDTTDPQDPGTETEGDRAPLTSAQGFRGTFAEMTGPQETFLSIAKGFVWHADRQFNYTYVHPSIRDVLGFTSEDMLGMNLLEGMSRSASDSIHRFMASHAWAEEQGGEALDTVLTFDTGHCHRDASSRRLRVSVAVVRDADGNPIGMVGASREKDQVPDLTEALCNTDRNAIVDSLAERTVALMSLSQQSEMERARRSRLEADLRDTETRYRFLFEEAPMGITEEDRSACKRYCENLRDQGVTDFRAYFKDHPEQVLTLLSMTTVVSLNRETRRLLAIKTCEEMTRNYAKIASIQGPEMLLDRAVLTAEAALHGITIDHSELTWPMPDGGKGTGISSFKVLPGYEETWDRVWVSVLDITDLRRAQAALRESENRFRSIFEAAEDAIFITGKDRTYSHVNPAMQRLLGMAAEDIIGKTYDEVFELRPSTSLKQLEERVLAGESIETEHTVSTSSGSITLNFLRFPILTRTGEVMGMCGIARDVTPRRPAHITSRRDQLAYPSQAMQRVAAELRSGVESDALILFLGESGTGKDYLARHLHEISWRRSGPFMAINCAALSPHLVESELFGHEAGAFTSATRRKRGLLELAEGGTIFLNEIGELSLPLQAKILTFLDTRSFTRVGGERNLTVDARIVAATNKDLNKEVLAGTFRKDLYFRLSVFPVKVPPLRDRLEDLDLLVRHILEDLMGKMTILEPLSLTQAAMERLERYHWPGNIRELRNVLERAVIMSDKTRITSRDVRILHDRDVPLKVGEEMTAQLSLEDGGDLQETLRNGEKTLIRRALRICSGNVTHAARRLGLTREQLKYRMRSLGIVRQGKSPNSG